MKPKIGDAVLIDPEDKLNLRPREAYVGICLSSDRTTSTILIKDPYKKMQIPNKYLYPLNNNMPSVTVERAYNKVRINMRDINILDTVKKVLSNLRETALDRMDYSNNHMLIDHINECCDHAIGSLDFIQSKLHRLVATQIENDITAEFIDRYTSYVSLPDKNDIEPEGIDITDDMEATEPVDDFADKMKIINGVIDSIKDGIDEDLDPSEVINKTILTSGPKFYPMDIMWMKTAMAYNMPPVDPQYVIRTFDSISGNLINFNGAIRIIKALMDTCGDEFVTIPVVTVMDPTKLILKLKKDFYNDDKNAFWEWLSDWEDGQFSTPTDFMKKNNLKVEDYVDIKSYPIIPLDGPLTVNDVLNHIKDSIRKVERHVYESTGTKFEMDELDKLGPNDSFESYFPVSVISASIRK